MKNESVEELKKTNYKEFLNSMKIDLSKLDNYQMYLNKKN